MTLAETLATIAEHAPELRKQGVTKVEVEGVSFELLPAEPESEAPVSAVSDEPQPEPDPLHDPWTFGGRKVPGRQGPREEDER